jgi:hypothetical protein
MDDAVPLPADALALARQLAEGRSVPDTIAAALRSYEAARRQTPAGAAEEAAEKDRFWAAADAAYARLRADPAAWASYRAELREWLGADLGPLPDEPPDADGGGSTPTAAGVSGPAERR